MPEQALVDGDPDLGAFHLATFRLAAQLPDELADLCNRLGRNGFAEARQAAAWVHRDASTQCGVAIVEQALRFTRLAQPDVLVPVELERRGQIVHLRETHIRLPHTRRG